MRSIKETFRESLIFQNAADRHRWSGSMKNEWADTWAHVSPKLMQDEETIYAVYLNFIAKHIAATGRLKE